MMHWESDETLKRRGHHVPLRQRIQTKRSVSPLVRWIMVTKKKKEKKKNSPGSKD
jgi:hypothetical protein